MPPVRDLLYSWCSCVDSGATAYESPIGTTIDHCYPVHYSDDGITWQESSPVPSYYIQHSTLHPYGRTNPGCAASSVEWIDSLSVFHLGANHYSEDGETWTFFEELVDALEEQFISSDSAGEWSDELSIVVQLHRSSSRVVTVSGIPELFRRVVATDP